MLTKKILTGLLSLLCSSVALAQVINSTTLPVAELAADASGNIYFCDATTIKKKTTGGVITTVAGTGTGGYSGDGGPATAAQIYSRGAITLDGAGNIYFLDSTARLRKVSASGIISTIAGTGVAGTTGDGGPATAAQISPMSGIAATAAGDVYFCNGPQIRKVSASGIITTVAGGSMYGYSGDGGPATLALINLVQSLVVDMSGNLLLADRLNNRVRKIDPSGIISTIAGTGAAGASADGTAAIAADITQPHTITVDNSGNIFFADFTFRIRKINAAGILTTVAGTGTAGCAGNGGPATAAQVWVPGSIAVDGSGVIYFSEGECSQTRRISAATAVADVMKGNTILVLPTINDGNFRIEGIIKTHGAYDEVLINVVDVTGRVRGSFPATLSDGAIDTKIALAGELADGIYFLNISNADFAETHKFVVQH
ncbi:MAG: T9SS type A sorting domain-containing protein [Taibaiella sp.]|nr:T9SS type A sorting domain-containing protein [Taibaiella sp.]